MENASKGLIIAGTILISILIISIGVYIYNKLPETSEYAKEANKKLDEVAQTEIAKINILNIENNEEFLEYINKNYTGKKLTKTQVIEMCEMVNDWGIKKTGKVGHSAICGQSDICHLSCREENLIKYNLNGTLNYDNLKEDGVYESIGENSIYIKEVTN